MSFFPREVIKTESFEGELAKLRPTQERLDEFISGAEWFLAREPQKGRWIPGTQVWAVSLLDPKSGPAVVSLFYVFDDFRVTFLSIKPFLRSRAVT